MTDNNRPVIIILSKGTPEFRPEPRREGRAAHRSLTTARTRSRTRIAPVSVSIPTLSDHHHHAFVHCTLLPKSDFVSFVVEQQGSNNANNTYPPNHSRNPSAPPLDAPPPYSDAARAYTHRQQLSDSGGRSQAYAAQPPMNANPNHQQYHNADLDPDTSSLAPSLKRGGNFFSSAQGVGCCEW